MPTVLPVAGQTAASTYSQSYLVCFTAGGREPVGAHLRLIVPCWRNRDSSWNQTSMPSPGMGSGDLIHFCVGLGLTEH